MSNKIQGYGQPAMPATSGSTWTTSTEAVNRGDAKPVEAVTPGRDSVSVSDSAVLLQKLEELGSGCLTDIERPEVPLR